MPDRPMPEGSPDPFADMATTLSDIVKNKIAVVGTFNPAAIGGLGLAPMQEIAANTEQMKNDIRRIREDGRPLAFGS